MFSALLAGWCVAVECHAQTTQARTFRSVVVTLTDGSVVEGCPDGQFFIDYQTGMVVLTDWEKMDILLDAERVTGWHYRTLTEDMITTGVQFATTDATRFSLTASGLRITDADADAVVYDLNGREVMRVSVAPEMEIPFAGLEAGIYVVRCGEALFKFMVR